MIDLVRGAPGKENESGQ